MQGPYRAHYTDGVGAHEVEVQVLVSPHALYILLPDGERLVWTVTELEGSRLSDSISYSHKASDACLVVYAGKDGFHHFPGLQLLERLDGLAKRLMFLGLLVGTVSLITVIIMALRPLSVHIAQRISPVKERELFAFTLPAGFIKKHGCHDAEAEALFQDLAARVSRQEQEDAPIDFLLLDWEMANAFALPGRRVIVTTGLLHVLHRSEELGAIISHELGHIKLRHNLSEFIRSSSAAAAWGLLVGDFSGAFVVDPSLLKQMGEMALSREFEREADDYAARKLLAEDFDPGALARALENLRQADNPDKGFREKLGPWLQNLEDLFSTHPRIEERSRHIRSHYPHIKSHEILEPASWAILQQACSKEKTL